jgi:hypothetical protein
MLESTKKAANNRERLTRGEPAVTTTTTTTTTERKRSRWTTPNSSLGPWRISTTTAGEP